MAIGSDFNIDYFNKRIYHSSGATVYSVNALYTYLQDTFDEVGQMDDPIPMSAQTPTNYTLINGWFMDDVSFNYFSGGAIETNGHSGQIQVLTLDGAYAAATADLTKQVKDDGGEIGALLYANDTLQKWWIRSTSTVADNSVMTITGGTGAGTALGASLSGENLWPNLYTLGTIMTDDSQLIYIVQAAARVTSWWSSGHIDVLVKTKEAGVEIDSGKVTIFLRWYDADLAPTRLTADLYDHFEIDLSGGGRNAVPLATSADLNNTRTPATIAAFSDIVIAWVNGTVTHGGITGTFTDFQTVTWPGSGTGVMLKDASGTMTIGNVNDIGSPIGPQNAELLTTATGSATTTAAMTVVKTMNKNFEQGSSFPYSVIINCATRGLVDIYERTKWITKDAQTSTYTYGTKMVTAALSIVKLEGQQYITPFIDYDTPANTYALVKSAPLGTFAGGKFFGSQGVWVENMTTTDIQNFQLIDANGTTRFPPNKQAISVSNLLSGDRVAVFISTGSGSTTVKKDMYTAAVGNVTSNTTFVVNETIAVDTPSTGVIRLVKTTDTTTNAREQRHTYSSWAGSTFSGVSPALTIAYTQTTDTAYVPFIDQNQTQTSASVTVIYTADRYLVARVRRKENTPIIPFEATGIFSSTGVPISAIRTTDTIVSTA
jgi:hypothetical protein